MKAVLTLDLLNTLTSCYMADPVFIDKYHECAGKGIHNCIKRSKNDLTSMSDLAVYDIVDEGILIGFFGKKFGKETDQLIGFFLKPNYRNNIKEFWNVIKKHFNRNFYCTLEQKNIPANKFLIKAGANRIANLGDSWLYRIEV